MPRGRAFVSTRILLGALLSAMPLLVGCNGPPGDRGDGDVADLILTDAVIGPAGGYLGWLGFGRLTIPRDVLEEDREFSIAVTKDAGAEIETGVAVSAVIAFAGEQERFVSPVVLEISYDTADLPDNFDPNALTLLAFRDGTWSPAKVWKVDAELGVVRGYTRQLGTWVVAAPPRDASAYTLEAQVAPTFLDGDPDSVVSEDLVVSATITAQAGAPLAPDDVRVHAEFYGTSRDSADAFAEVSWGPAAPTSEELIPDAARRAALPELASAWDTLVALNGLALTRAGDGDRAEVALTISREILTAFRAAPAAVYRIDLWVSAGRWPAQGRSSVTRVYLYSPRYLPLVAVEDGLVDSPAAAPAELTWRYGDAYYEVVAGVDVPADPGGLTLLLSDTADPYTQPRWRLSNNGARRPRATDANLAHEDFVQVAVNPALGEATWSCVLPAEVRSQLTPGEYTWAVITDSSVEWEQDTATDPFFWPQIPDGRRLPWLLLDTVSVSDTDDNGVHDFQSSIFRFTVDASTGGLPDDCGGELPCDTSGLETCTTAADCAVGEICSNGFCVPEDIPVGGGTPTPSDFLVFALGGGDSMTLRRITPGTFKMGSAAGYPDEQPVHTVTIMSAFYMQQTEVTQDQWFAVMGTSPSIFTGSGEQPVEWVSWEDATQFCTTLSAAISRTVRLPSEAEWEYACRAGTDTVYHFGDDANDFGDYGWFIGNSGSLTHPVRQKLPNGLGLYDMHGNVWEWCQDWYADDYYASSPATDPPGPATGDARVVRGGSWERGSDIGSSTRGRSTPGVRHNGLGFRVVVE